jgi:hypothetical protein
MDLAGIENGVQCPLHRLVHGRRALVCSHSQVTTLSAPNDASLEPVAKPQRRNAGWGSVLWARG